jgi:hypothetical protein
MFTANSISLLRRIRAGPVGQGWVDTSPSPPMAKIGGHGLALMGRNLARTSRGPAGRWPCELRALVREVDAVIAM